MEDGEAPFRPKYQLWKDLDGAKELPSEPKQPQKRLEREGVPLDRRAPLPPLSNWTLQDPRPSKLGFKEQKLYLNLMEKFSGERGLEALRSGESYETNNVVRCTVRTRR